MLSLDEFNDQLDEMFSGRLRVRRSLTRESTLFVEERVGGEVTMSDLISDLKPRNGEQARKRADDRKRARDRYKLVMELQLGTKSACTACLRPFDVPRFESKEIKCSCGHKFTTAFFPLGDQLLYHLRKIDSTLFDQKRRIREEDARKSWLDDCEQNSLGNEVGYAYGDALIEQIPAARLACRTSMWIDAPTGPRK